MRDLPGREPPPRWRLVTRVRSGLPAPEATGLAWLWVYLGVWVLFALWMGASHPALVFGYQPRFERYAKLWLGDHGGVATLQVTVMAVQILMVVFLWLRFRGLRRHRRMALGPYLLFGGLALLLLGLQQVFYDLSALESQELLRLPQSEGVPVPGPAPLDP